MNGMDDQDPTDQPGDVAESTGTPPPSTPAPTEWGDDTGDSPMS